MKKLIFLSLLVSTNISHAQVLKLQSGISVSALNWQREQEPAAWDNPITKPFLSIGLDYLDKKYFNLSSNLGLLQKGGREYYSGTTGNGMSWSQTATLAVYYASFNTTIDIKYPLWNCLAPFISIGPRVDYFRRSSPDFPLMNNEMEKFSFGLNAGAGIKYSRDRYMAGIRFDYLFNFNDVAQFTYNKRDVVTSTRGFDSPATMHVKDRTYLWSIMLGYKLKAAKHSVVKADTTL